MTTGLYCIKDGYTINPTPSYFTAQATDLPNQLAVYQVARTVSEQQQRTIVVDVGCGSGGKLLQFWPESRTIGVDFGSNVDYCRRMFPQKDWRDINLETQGVVDLVTDWQAGLLICADVIEHLVQPECLLTSIREVTRRGGICLISTPERDLCRGRHDRGPPLNPSHVREWNLGEFFSLVSAYSPVRHAQLVPWRLDAERAETILFQV